MMVGKFQRLSGVLRRHSLGLKLVRMCSVQSARVGGGVAEEGATIVRYW